MVNNCSAGFVRKYIYGNPVQLYAVHHKKKSCIYHSAFSVKNFVPELGTIVTAHSVLLRQNFLHFCICIDCCHMVTVVSLKEKEPSGVGLYDMLVTFFISQLFDLCTSVLLFNILNF